MITVTIKITSDTQGVYIDAVSKSSEPKDIENIVSMFLKNKIKEAIPDLLLEVTKGKKTDRRPHPSLN